MGQKSSKAGIYDKKADPAPLIIKEGTGLKADFVIPQKGVDLRIIASSPDGGHNFQSVLLKRDRIPRVSGHTDM